MKKIYYAVFLMLISTVLSVGLFAQGLDLQKHKIGVKGKKIIMPKFDKKSLQYEDSINEIYKVGGVRFATKFDVDLSPQNSGETIINSDGSLQWLLDIKSDSAYSINLLFTKFKLEEGDTIYVYNTNKSKIVGPLTAKDNLKSGQLPIVPIDGDAITVELRQSAKQSSTRAIQIGEVNHDYRGFRGLPSLISATNDDCSLHASCVPEIAVLKQSVCLLILGGTELCTGALINNTANDGKPYVLTAAHCFGQAESQDYANALSLAPSVIAFFNYEAPLCNPSIRGTIEHSIGGTALRAYAKDLDLALIELSSTPPVDYRPYFAGWNISTTPSAPFFGIHHPYGTVKRYIKENHAITAVSYGGKMLPLSHWRVAHWEIGTTEGGSSGSPLFDVDGKIVGALTGGNSYCSTPVNDDYYRLNKAWSYYSESYKQLKAWLDPTNSGVTSLNGMNPYGQDTALRYTHLSSSETLKKAYLSNGNTGMLSGQNSSSISEYGEKFELNKNAYLYGVYVMPAKSNADLSDLSPNKITISVYEGSQSPEVSYLLGYKQINLRTLQWNGTELVSTKKAAMTGNENYVKFDTPIAVGKNFYITYSVPYTNLPTDSFCVYTVANRTSGGLETAYVKQSGAWNTMYNFSGVRTSLWIDPIIRYDTAAIVLDTSRIERGNSTVVYPNPAKDLIKIMTRDDKFGECKVSLFNYLGYKLKETKGKVLYPSIEIDVEDVPSGVYYLRVEYLDKTETHKLIIRK